MTKRKHKSEAPKGFNLSLGRSLVNRSKGLAKERRQQNNPNQIAGPTSANDALKSITHETDLEEFFCNAELSNANFEATKNDIRLIQSNNTAAIPIEHFENRAIDQLYAQYGELLKIPRRPKQGTFKNANELDALESAEFLEWRRKLAKLSEGSGVVITPFERNLEIWRQLWRVLERSHVVVQIVDARNPLLFRNIDLESYVKEIDSRKANLLLINKADLLTSEQIQCWKEYFNRKGIEAIFWSTIENEPKNENPEEEEEDSEESDEDESKSEENSDYDSDQTDEENPSTDENNEEEENTSESEIESTKEEEEKAHSPKFISSPEELLSTFYRVASEVFPGLKNSDGEGEGFVIGLVGYPNVGKSSTINRLIQQKKTAVSATPGKTKHFQTLIVNSQITLCDCPGLTLPSFGLSNSEMILNGILPIAHMRDHYSPIQLLCNRIPRQILQQHYSILLPKQIEADRPVQAHDFLTSVAFLRGFMSSSGVPDCSRAARIILLDFVKGDPIKWCAAPPDIPQEQFDYWTFQSLQISSQKSNSNSIVGATLLSQLEKRNLLLEKGANNVEKMGTKLDRQFFDEIETKNGMEGGNVAHIKGGMAKMNLMGEKGRKKHFNRNKREKLRRIFVTT